MGEAGGEAGVRYSSERLYAVLAGRDKLLDERQALRQALDEHDESKRLLEETRPSRVEDLAEWRHYTEQREVLDALSTDINGRRERLRKIESELAAIPERLLDKQLIPPGLWVRYGERGIRVDRESPSLKAELSEYPWEAVEKAASADIEAVADAERALRPDAIERFLERNPSVNGYIRLAPVAVGAALVVFQMAEILITGFFSNSEAVAASGFWPITAGLAIFTATLCSGIASLLHGGRNTPSLLLAVSALSLYILAEGAAGLGDLGEFFIDML